MSKAKLLEAVLDAPTENWDAIISAAKGSDKPRPRPISPREACEVLGVCRRSLTRYANRGALTPIRLSPRKIRYDLNEVEALAFGEVTA